MDSFYDVPRRAPVPTQVEKLFAAPAVPEVSMLCTSKTSANNYAPYNAWKSQQQLATKNAYPLTSNGGNIIKSPHNFSNPVQFSSPQNSSQFLKKQVRFQSPVLQQRPSLTYEPFSRKKEIVHQNEKPNFLVHSNNIKADQQKNGLPISNKSFEQIYMANIPNRQLDLSILDFPNNTKSVEKCPSILKENDTVSFSTETKENNNLLSEIHKNKENVLPKTYREFLETQKKVVKNKKVHLNDSVIDIFNYKRNNGGADKENSGDSRNDISSSNPPIAVNGCKPARNFNPQTGKIEDTFGYQNFDFQSPKIIENVHDKYPKSNIHEQLTLFPVTSPLKCDSVTQTSKICLSPLQTTEELLSSKNHDSGPSNMDLLKIIAQQNEQLLQLQKQVGMLLSREQNQVKPIEDVPQRMDYKGETCVTSTQNEHFINLMQDANGSPRKRGLSKFSIDLMTSFEVAIRHQHNKQNFINCEPKIQEVTELESLATDRGSAADKNEKTVDQSLHFKEPVNVQEMCPSPEPSININMNDYDSSDDEVSSSELGATFYNNLMGQVNNILKKAQIQTRDDIVTNNNDRISENAEKKNRTVNRVKEATLKHLKNIGVTIGPIEESDSSENTSDDSSRRDYSPTQISFAVKQLLMKYLPDEQLAKITFKQAHRPNMKNDKPGITPMRPEFSFASVQYMKKYNLIPSNEPNEVRNKEQIHMHRPSRPRVDNPKILDMTALKMQPKLL